MCQESYFHQSVQVSRLNASLEFYGKDVETGVLASVTDAATFIIASTGSEIDAAYVNHKITIGGVTRNIIRYGGSSRQVCLLPHAGHVTGLS